MRSSNLSKVEEAPIEKALECNLTITGSLIQQKALQFAELLGTTDFKASSGWPEKFKKRYSISAFNKHGESQSAPVKEMRGANVFI
ncbi:4443_t:CDS:2 [Paraglomus brasilianum]|uniref:4443_t:CDS:1 n=1 Tax=Paraglomus brasilianum TaxID=144538 RepID=A0A9N9B4T0_9GLOM|nr:4443_t:CDS:2 [Paraglomus brasilianum]